ncbi:MAG: hypothetical protein FJ096_11345 [Deltaproteobacteria bacterium]|nr:hypothetical protein [Deltaproteobacteria bacterium]
MTTINHDARDWISASRPRGSAPRPSLRAGLLGVAALLVAPACGYRPPRFVDAPPALRVDDMTPVPVPAHRTLLAPLNDANIYVRRELVRAMDPRRAGDAGDVNALDGVPESSWFHRLPVFDKPLLGYRRDGAPVQPLIESKDAPVSGLPGARVFVDARGLRFELVPDDAERPGMRIGAMAATSRLLFALGYRTDEVNVVEHAGSRFAATRWPVGIDLGPTPQDRPRRDDPNDRLDHRDRRSLRAFKLAAAWLDIVHVPPRCLRDHYVGEPGKGHVEHAFVGIDGGLGVDRYQERLAWQRDPERSDDNLFLRMVSLGLSPVPAASPPGTPFPSVGLLEDHLLVGSFKPSPPFEPIDRLTPGDAYWMAKRIATVPPRVFQRAAFSSRMPNDAQRWLARTLEERRAAVVAWGYDRVSPLEAGFLHAADPTRGRGPRFQLVDLAVMSGMTSSATSRYDVRYLDADGAALGFARAVVPVGAVVTLELPASVVSRERVVVRVTALRAGVPLPRAAEFHLVRRPSGFAVVGVRH